MELKLKTLSHDSEIKKDKLFQIRNSNNQTDNKLNMLFQENKIFKEQLNQIILELRNLSQKMEDLQAVVKRNQK
jgi:chromosome segregation ATPase